MNLACGSSPPAEHFDIFWGSARCCVLVTAVAVYQLLVAGTVAVAADVVGDANVVAFAVAI